MRFVRAWEDRGRDDEPAWVCTLGHGPAPPPSVPGIPPPPRAPHRHSNDLHNRQEGPRQSEEALPSTKCCVISNTTSNASLAFAEQFLHVCMIPNRTIIGNRGSGKSVSLEI